MTEHKCKVCHQGIPRFAPVLRQSGWPQPKDLKCPVCDAFHDSKSGLPTEEAKEKEKERKFKNMGIDNPRDAYPRYWGP